MKIEVRLFLNIFSLLFRFRIFLVLSMTGIESNADLKARIANPSGG